MGTLNTADYDAGEIAMARRYAETLVRAEKAMNAQPSDIFGLWTVPGYPELTNGQLLDVWRQRNVEALAL